MKIVRSIGAVVAGYLLFAASAGLLFQLSGRNPHAPQSVGFMLVATFYGMTFAAFGGLLAARIAPSRSLLHAAVLSGVIALGAAVSLLTSPSADARWSQWSALLFMAPCAYLAARLGGYGTFGRAGVNEST